MDRGVIIDSLITELERLINSSLQNYMIGLVDGRTFKNPTLFKNFEKFFYNCLLLDLLESGFKEITVYSNKSFRSYIYQTLKQVTQQHFNKECSIGVRYNNKEIENLQVNIGGTYSNIKLVSNIVEIRSHNSSRIYLIDPTDVLLDLVSRDNYKSVIAVCNSDSIILKDIQFKYYIYNLNSKVNTNKVQPITSTLQTEDLLELQQYRELGSIDELKEELELFRKISGSIYHKVSKDISNGKVNIIIDSDNLFLD